MECARYSARGVKGLSGMFDVPNLLCIIRTLWFTLIVTGNIDLARVEEAALSGLAK